MAHIEAIELKKWNDKASLSVRAVFNPGEMILNTSEIGTVSWDSAVGQLEALMDDKLNRMSPATQENGDGKITDKQLDYMIMLIDGNEEIVTRIRDTYGVESLEELKKWEASEVIEGLKQ